MPFSFLHISDLHFDKETASGGTFRDEIKRQVKALNLTADCLIISGDLFNRGKLKREEVGRFEDFLADIPGRQYTVVVPGNHDLDRSAQKAKDGSYNVFLTRRWLVPQKGKRALDDGQFSINSDEKDILYKGAYEAFFTFSRQMKFKSFMQKDPAPEAKWYEVQVVSNSFSNFPCKIKFVLLNTGLIAGQAIRGEEYKKKRKSLKDEVEKAKAEDKLVEAAEKQVQLAKQQERYVNDGELIIDEEESGESVGGRLSLSTAGLRALNQIGVEDTELTVFVGHHGYQFLSSETKKALKRAMINSKSGIYLCGHAHRAGYKRILIGHNTMPGDIAQIQAGVLFKDAGGYTQYGFNHGVFDVDTNNTIKCTITSYFLIESASGDLRWMSETISIPLDGINPPPQVAVNRKTQSLDPEEKEGNFVNTPDPEPHNPHPPIPPEPQKNTSSSQGPISTASLRSRFLDKQPPPKGEQKEKEQ